MSLEYYLFCRKRYTDIIINLENILESYDMMDNYNKEEKEKGLKGARINCEHSVCKNFFVEKKQYIIKQKTICDVKINKLCEHKFEDDTIDITPDRSENITYCKTCGYTK